jgi:nicotinamide-nucleotide amidase
VAYLASSGEVKIRLTAKAADEASANALIDPVAQDVVGRLGDVVFTTEDEELEEAVLRLLGAAGMKLCTAESLTGGSLAGRITEVPGASDSFVGGVVTYDAEQKARLLKVSEATLADPGPVSRECAHEMAQGALELFPEARIAVALTGVAGPEPHGGQPVGQTWVGIESDTGISHQRGFRAPGDRDQVRRWAQQVALDLVRRALSGLPLPD